MLGEGVPSPAGAPQAARDSISAPLSRRLMILFLLFKLYSSLYSPGREASRRPLNIVVNLSTICNHFRLIFCHFRFMYFYVYLLFCLFLQFSYKTGRRMGCSASHPPFYFSVSRSPVSRSKRWSRSSRSETSIPSPGRPGKSAPAAMVKRSPP